MQTILGFSDPTDRRLSVMILLFLKELNDTFEENEEKLIQADKNDEKEAYCQITTYSQMRKPVTETKTIKEEESNERLADSNGKGIE